MSIASCTLRPPKLATPGGAIGGRRMPRMWGGDWTTTWLRRNWRRARHFPPHRGQRADALERLAGSHRRHGGLAVLGLWQLHHRRGRPCRLRFPRSGHAAGRQSVARTFPANYRQPDDFSTESCGQYLARCLPILLSIWACLETGPRPLRPTGVSSCPR